MILLRETLTLHGAILVKSLKKQHTQKSKHNEGRKSRKSYWLTATQHHVKFKKKRGKYHEGCWNTIKSKT
jgi:hypothetical protein